MEKIKDWFKPRGYPHIDSKLSLNDRSIILKKVQNSRYVTAHAFLPLLFKTISVRRFKKVGKDDKGNAKYSHSKDGKPTKKVRPIHFASHIDAQIYAYYSQKILGPAYEKILNQIQGLSNCVSAYRSIKTPNGKGSKCNIHFAKDAFDEIERRGECIAIAMDIESFFSSLDHKILLKRWQFVIGKDSLPSDHYNLYKSITKFRYINLNEFRINRRTGFDEKEIASFKKKGIQSYFASLADFRERVERKEFIVRQNQFKKRLTNGKKVLIGIPQGLPISAMLANIYMYQFDLILYDELTIKRGIFYRRYSDDIVIVCDKEQKDFALSFVKETITGEEVSLTISESKTEISHFKQYKEGSIDRFQVWRIDQKSGKETRNIPFKYLGFEYYGYQTLIKSNNLSAFYRRMKQAIKRKSIIADHVKEKTLGEYKILHKTQLYRLFSYKGIKRRILPEWHKTILVKNQIGSWDEKRIPIKNKYRGNALSYAHKASEIMNAPEIIRQYRNHFKILQKTVKRYEFDNY